MLNKLKISISKPALVFAFIKDKAGQIIKYLLLMMLLMILPALISTFTNPKALFPSSDLISEGIKKTIVKHNFQIADNKLVNPENNTAAFKAEDYAVIVGDGSLYITGFIIHFKTDEIQLYMQLSGTITQPYKSLSYQQANLNNVDIDGYNASLVANRIVNIISDDSMLKSMKVFQIFFANLLEYLFIALLLAFLFRMSNRLPMPFKNSFVISVYLTSIWAVTILILTLFGYEELRFIALIAVYIYHIWAYRSIRMVRKIKVDKKDDK